MQDPSGSPDVTETVATVPPLSPSSSASVLSTTSSPLLELPPSLSSPDLDKSIDKRTLGSGLSTGGKRRAAPRKSRTGVERRGDVVRQLGSLELDRALVLRIAHEIEQWGSTSSDRPLLVKVVTPSDQQLVRLIADYYDGLESELDWAGVRIERGSSSGSGEGSTGWESPPTPLAEALLSASRTRTSTAPPLTATAPSSHPRPSPLAHLQAELTVAIPRRWSSDYNPEPRRQPGPSSSCTATTGQDSLLTSRRGSVQLETSAGRGGTSSPSSDPGGYESLTWGSVQRPSPLLSSNSTPTFASPWSDQESAAPAFSQRSLSVVRSPPASPTSSIPGPQPAFGQPYPYALPHPALPHVHHSVTYPRHAHSAPHSPERVYQPGYIPSVGYPAYGLLPSFYPPTSVMLPYASSPDGSTDIGQPVGRQARGGRTGKRGGQRTRGGSNAREGRPWAPADETRDWRGGSRPLEKSSERSEGGDGAGVEVTSGSFPRLPSAPRSSCTPTTDSATALPLPTPSYRAAALRTVPSPTGKAARHGETSKPVAAPASLGTSSLEIDLSKLTVRGDSPTARSDPGGKLSWASVVKGG